MRNQNYWRGRRLRFGMCLSRYLVAWQGLLALLETKKSSVIPGVCIATALMPPVYAAGFGVASGQWAFVGGALYLYTINCVFIALATVIGIRLLRLKRHRFADERSGGASSCRY